MEASAKPGVSCSLCMLKLRCDRSRVGGPVQVGGIGPSSGKLLLSLLFKIARNRSLVETDWIPTMLVPRFSSRGYPCRIQASGRHRVSGDGTFEQKKK